MSNKFDLYGKNPSIEMERAAIAVQEKYDIQDNVLCALLKISDYFGLIGTMRVPIEQVELHDGKTVKAVPEKTRKFFATQFPKKCSDSLKLFNPYSAPENFDRLAKYVLARSFKLSEYVTNGIPVAIPKENTIEVVYEYKESA